MVFSIIIPVYNAELHLRQCIESVLVQSFRDFELILVDDGSTDSSGKICDEYAKKDNRIIVIHQENSGVSAARNHGLERAKGEHIAFIDSDDYVDKNYLGAFDLDNDLCVQGFKTLRGDLITKDTHYSPFTISVDAGIYYQLSDINSAVWSKSFKIEIIRQYNIDFPEDLSFSEDTIFLKKYLLHCQSFSVAPQSEYIYRLPSGEKSMSQRQYPLEVLLEKEKRLYELNHLIFEKSPLKKQFFHNIALMDIAKYRINAHHLSYQQMIEHVFLRDTINKYLKSHERFILKTNVDGFVKYVMWRRRIRKYIIKPLFRIKSPTILNV